LEIRLEIDAWLMIAKPFKNTIMKKTPDNEPRYKNEKNFKKMRKKEKIEC